MNKDEKRLMAKHPLASLGGIKLTLMYLAVDEDLRKGRIKYYDSADKRLTTPEQVLDVLLDGKKVTMEKA